MNGNFVYLDVETTGGSLRTDKIIEIGAIRVEKNKQVGKLNFLINPDRYLPPEITMLTGIESKDLENAKNFQFYAQEVFDFLQDATLVAHNASFDYSFLKKEF